jgi:aminoglycoside/choline kinase family phosphotransferase
LQTAVQGTPREQTIIAWYKTVIDILQNLSILGAKGFDSSWAYQTPTYDKQLILDRECRYFIEAFLNAYLGWKISFDTYQDEFISLASKALENPVIGFMHRDLQSRNIMLKKNELYLIDFQGGRLGPIQYDLASLLIDPYVEMPGRIQSRLLDYCIERLTRRISVDAHKFRHCFRYCCLTRNLQILGAFGQLSKVTGKTYFERYIPAALRSLNKNLAGDTGAQFPKLRHLAQKVN